MIIKILSRRKIVKLLYSSFPRNTAVISFFGYDEKAVRFPEGIICLRLNIDDLSETEIDDPDSFRNSDFRRIANFILDCVDKQMNIICQCEEGISRSAAIAAAILELYEQGAINIFSDYRYNPNKVFYKNTLKHLREEYGRRELLKSNSTDKDQSAASYKEEVSS